jgi:hypothetical protein
MAANSALFRKRSTLKVVGPPAMREEYAMTQEALMEGRRQELLALLERYVQDGARRVNWLTTQDEHVCAPCASREQRGALTIAEVRTILQGPWCEAPDLDLGCRCILTVVETDFDEMP